MLVLELISVLHETGGSLEHRHRLSATQRRRLADMAQKQSKSEKIEEWRSLPLSNDQQRQTWWTVKQNCFSEPKSSSPSDRFYMEVDVIPAMATGQQESTRADERVVSPAQTPLSSAYTASPSTTVSIGTEESTLMPASTVSLANASYLVRERESDIPDLPVASAAKSPATNPDRWRKYF